MVKSAKLKSIYGKKTVDDQKQIYKNWAETYDADTLGDFGWVGFKPAADEFAKRVKDKSALVMDAGCGTGLSGVALSQVGFTNIHGYDLSPEMLMKAKETGVYDMLNEIDLTNPIKVDQSYDAIFSCGVFGFGPPYIEHLRHLLATLKPDGYAIITVNGKGWIDKNWEQELPKVIEQHSLNLEEQLEIDYLENENIKASS